jgi:hypothetical protein
MLELALAIGLLVSFFTAGIGAATSASDSPLLWVSEACCLCAVGLVVIELRPRAEQGS